MPMEVACPFCESTFRVAEQHLGKQGKCPRCLQRFVIGGSAPAPPPVAPPPLPPEATTAAQSTESHAQSSRFQAVGAAFRRQFATGQRAATITTIVASLVVGYFAGRQHLKYEARSAFEDAGNAFASGLKDAFGGNDIEDQPEPAPVGFKQWFTTPGLQLAVIDARIVDLDIQTDEEKYKHAVQFTLVIRNTDDRRVFRYSGNSIVGPKLTLRDDVDNDLHPWNPDLLQGVTSSSFQEVEPGKEVQVREGFRIPLPRTEYLMLKVDLSVCEKEGLALFKIPIDQVAGFKRS